MRKVSRTMHCCDSFISSLDNYPTFSRVFRKIIHDFPTFFNMEILENAENSKQTRFNLQSGQIFMQFSLYVQFATVKLH